MRKFYVTFLILLVTHLCISQVNVEVSDLKVNNVVSGNINFNNQDVINVSFKAKLKTFNDDPNNILGNLYVKTKESQNTLFPVQKYIQAVTFTVQYPPFVTQITYNASFDVSVQLNASEYYASGGVLYCEYVNNTTTAFLSTEKSIVGGKKVPATDTGSLTNDICCNQTIRYGDKPNMITGNLVAGQISAGWYSQNGYFSGNQAADVKNTLDPDYMFSTMTFTRLLGNAYPYKRSNEVTITVVQTPIISNTIGTNAVLVSEGVFEIGRDKTVEFYGNISKANLNILNNPAHLPAHFDLFDDVTEYQWQYKNFTHLNTWVNIVGATAVNLTAFTPQYTTYGYKVRRIAKYQGISRVSNEIEIVVRGNTAQNVICCDQVLISSASGIQLPEIITGSEYIFNIYDHVDPSDLDSFVSFSILYQWQKQNRSLSWENVDSNGNSKDYLPPSLGRGGNVKYRRVLTINYKYYAKRPFVNLQNVTKVYYSNEVSLTVSGGIRGRNTKGDSLQNWDVNKRSVVFPNPVATVLSVSNIFEASKSIVTIIDETGREIAIDNNVEKNEDMLSINVSKLPKGVYFLKIENNADIVFKKFIKE